MSNSPSHGRRVAARIFQLGSRSRGHTRGRHRLFFDDPVHQVFGFKDLAFQSLHHVTLGGAVEDPRLTTLPPQARICRDRNAAWTCHDVALVSPLRGEAVLVPEFDVGLLRRFVRQGSLSTSAPSVHLPTPQPVVARPA